jgi:hypothetical protein
MKLASRWLLLLIAVVFSLPLTAGSSQDAPLRQTGVLRLRARLKLTDSSPVRGLARKRFFLIHGSLEQNRALVEAIERQPLMTRDCYYTKNSASPALMNWLKEGDCESVYCREVEQQFVSGPKAVPEFATAFAASEKEFGSAGIALKWLTTNVPPNLRDGFYRDRKNVLAALIKQAQTTSGAPLQSALTDRHGTAFFTDLGPGTYVLSNLVPAEFEQNLATWNCEVQIKADDLAGEKLYVISNRKDRLVKCLAIEKPTPPCQ